MHMAITNPDVVVFQWINNITIYWPIVGAFAVFGAVILVWCLVVWYVSVLIKNHDRRGLIFFIGGGVGLKLISILLGQIWLRPRPFAAMPVNLLIHKNLFSKSFPSDHAALAFFVAFLLAPYYKRIWWIYVLAAVIALSRVMVGVHYPIDIMVGAILGLGMGYTVTRLAERQDKFNDDKQTSALKEIN